MELKEALKKIENENDLKLKFYENPSAVLKSLDVDTTDLKIAKSSNEDTKMLNASFCVSVGAFVGASVG